MSLINCKECNAEMSDKAASCPRCGNPAQKQPPSSPKKSNGGLFEFVGFVMIVAGMVGCTANDTPLGWPSVVSTLGFVVFLAGRFMR